MAGNKNPGSSNYELPGLLEVVIMAYRTDREDHPPAVI